MLMFKLKSGAKIAFFPFSTKFFCPFFGKNT